MPEWGGVPSRQLFGVRRRPASGAVCVTTGQGARARRVGGKASHGTGRMVSNYLKRASVLVRRYRERHNKSDLYVEAEIRLKQAAYFLRRFRETDAQPQNSEKAIVVRAYREAFYYLAWRAREALSEIGFKVNAVGLRDVRNRLIEHPTGPGGFMVSLWMFDCPEGLVLTPVHLRSGAPAGAPTDRGLYPNAQEFIDKLLPKLEAALSGAGGRQHSKPVRKPRASCIILAVQSSTSVGAWDSLLVGNVVLKFRVDGNPERQKRIEDVRHGDGDVVAQSRSARESVGARIRDSSPFVIEYRGSRSGPVKA